TDWLESNLGKIFSRVFIVMIGVYLLLMAGVTLKETIIWTNVSYLIETPIAPITILFAIPFLLAALTTLRTIVILNFFFLFFVIIFGFFVAFTNVQFKDFSLLLPMLEHGWVPIFRAMVYQGSGMVEMIVLLFI